LCVRERLFPLAARYGDPCPAKQERIGLLRILRGLFRLRMGGTRVSFGKECIDPGDSLVGIVLLGRFRQKGFGL